MRKTTLALALAVCTIALTLRASADTVVYQPLDHVALVELGYQDTTLRGRSVLGDYNVPGPGDFLVNNENFLDLDYFPSPVLSRGSNLQVLWNGVPLRTSRSAARAAAATSRSASRARPSIRTATGCRSRPSSV